MPENKKWERLFCPQATPIRRFKNFKNVEVSIKRDDLNHKVIQGNKLRKLKYNIKYAIENGFSQVATFGGAHSNHLIATAQAAWLTGLKSIGFVRGDELKNNKDKWSKTLIQAEQIGMELVFLDRECYRLKEISPKVKKYLRQLPYYPYIIPEGGSNNLAITGVVEIIDELVNQMPQATHIVCACGTGGTLAGLIDGVAKYDWHARVIGIPVLKGAQFLEKDIKLLAKNHSSVNWQLYYDYHAGGFAKLNAMTLAFAKKFSHMSNIDLDRVYTAKSFFASYDLIRRGEIPARSSLIILHTGGLQGGVIR